MKYEMGEPDVLDDGPLLAELLTDGVVPARLSFRRLFYTFSLLFLLLTVNTAVNILILLWCQFKEVFIVGIILGVILGIVPGAVINICVYGERELQHFCPVIASKKINIREAPGAKLTLLRGFGTGYIAEHRFFQQILTVSQTQHRRYVAHGVGRQLLQGR